MHDTEGAHRSVCTHMQAGLSSRVTVGRDQLMSYCICERFAHSAFRALTGRIA